MKKLLFTIVWSVISLTANVNAGNSLGPYCDYYEAAYGPLTEEIRYQGYDWPYGFDREQRPKQFSGQANALGKTPEVDDSIDGLDFPYGFKS
ncbi:MAG: hypothetical protein PVG66_14730 [Chromatiales bacterium]|jgi:hypothetical protein